MIPFVLFFLSGVAALILEIVFLRQLAWMFGNAAVATSLVLTAFMAGLGIGAAAFGRLADRVARPLRLFGWLELGVGLSGAGLAWLLGAGRELLITPLRALPQGGIERGLEFLLAFSLVCVPTVLMGGSLPALSRFAVRDPERLLAPIGMLYGLNTLGGAVGVFIAGFYLFEALGVAGSAYAAAALDVAVGAGALAIDRLRASPGSSGPEAASPSLPAGQGEDRSRWAGEPVRRGVCIGAVCLGGFSVLGYEVVWTRLLALPMRSFSYSFSLMLALFLLGLVMGALALAALARRIRHPLIWFGWCQILIGTYVATSLLWLPSVLNPGEPASSFGGFLTRSALRAAPVVLPPTILSGMALLLAIRSLAPARERIAREVGVVYAANTAGAIAGALLTGLTLLPLVGGPRALSILAVVNCVAGLLIFATRRPFGVRVPLAAALLLATGMSLGLPTGRFVTAFLQATRAHDTIGELLFFHEGAVDSVAIVRRDYGFRDPEAKSLITNGIAMSATVKPVWRYMTLEGHLPVLLAGSPRDALVIGIGTGITLGSVVSHPDLETIDAVELSDGVIEGLAYFQTESRGALDDPRVNVIREDGRHLLALNRKRYDLITLEPPPPIVAGAVHLYAFEFYDLCRNRLRPGGVVAQWLPLHAQSLASAKMTARTFLDAFPHVQLWLPSVRDAVLIGSDEPIELRLDRLLAAYREPATAASLTEGYLETPEALLATFLMDRRGLELWTAGAPRITDERPRMEFFRHQGGNMSDRDIAGLLEGGQADLGWVRGLDREGELRERVIRENRALRGYVRSYVEARPALGAEAARQSSATEFLLYRFGCTAHQLRTLASRGAQSASHYQRQLRRCETIRGLPPS